MSTMRKVTYGIKQKLLRKRWQWVLRLECGHVAYRDAHKVPKRVRCGGCIRSAAIESSLLCG